MLIEVICSKCSKKFGVRHTAAGSTARCPFCSTNVNVPKTALPERVESEEPVGAVTQEMRIESERDQTANEFDVLNDDDIDDDDIDEEGIDEEDHDVDDDEYEYDDDEDHDHEHDDDHDEDDEDDHAHDPFGKKQRKEFHDLIDMTAMVDIVFFLLIYFLVTSMYSLKPAIQMPTPEQSGAGGSGSSSEGESNVVNARIDEKDVIYIDDVAVSGERELRLRLDEIVRNGGPKQLKITGNPDATHGTLVMVMDVGAGASMKVQFVVKSTDDF